MRQLYDCKVQKVQKAENCTWQRPGGAVYSNSQFSDMGLNTKKREEVLVVFK